MAYTLLDAGSNVSAVDEHKRTPLHYAVIASTGDSFEMEERLIKRGSAVNARDKRNRTPLHYAFIKVGGRKDVTKIDPIETISSIYAVKGKCFIRALFFNMNIQYKK